MKKEPPLKKKPGWKGSRATWLRTLRVRGEPLRHYLVNALDKTDGHVGRAARLLGITDRSLRHYIVREVLWPEIRAFRARAQRERNPIMAARALLRR